MANAATGFDKITETQLQEEGDGLRQAQHDDLSSKKAIEDGLPSAHQGYRSSKREMKEDHDDLSSKKAMEDGLPSVHQDRPSSRQEMEEGHVDGVHGAQHGYLSSTNITQEGYDDAVHMPPHGESNNEKVTEEGFDDGLHRAQHGFLSSKKETQEGSGSGLHRAQQCDLSCEQTMEDGHSDGKAETERSHEYAAATPSMSPQHEKATNAQTPHDSCIRANLTDLGTLSEHHNQCTILHGEQDEHANSAACGTSCKHPIENVTAAQELGVYADQNIGDHGRPRQHSYAPYMALFETSGEHPHENGVANGTLGGHAINNASASGTSGQHAGGDIFANVDFSTDGGQLGRYPHKSMFANGNVGEFGQGSAFEDSFKNDDFRGNVYDHMSTSNESDPNAHAKMTTCDETGGEDFKINLTENVSSMQPISLTNSPIKSGSLLSGSSYYTTQYGFMKNTGLVLRFGCAIFSLIAFSVIISTNEKRVAAGSTFYVKFSDYQAYNYLAALNLLSFLYSSGQLVLLAQTKSNSILSSPVKWGASIYLCDQMLAFLMVSSSSSAATASELSRHGLRNIWPPACSTWKLSFFCSKADVAVAMSFISFLFILLSSFSSGYHLSNLLAE